MSQRIFLVRLLGAVVLLSGVAAVQQEGRPAFYLEKDGYSYIIAEAEDFSGAGSWRAGQWEPGDYNDGRSYFADAIGGAYMSRQRYLGAAEKGQGAWVWQDVEVPHARNYYVWARYESPYEYNTCFGVRVEQGNKVVFDALYGAVENNKLWPLGVGNRPQMDWGYGGGDNVCWEGVGRAVSLQAGSARLYLYTVGNPEPAARRNVDVIMLTDDAAEDGHNKTDPWLYQLDAQGRLFLRITNKAEKPAYFTAWTYYNRRPGGGTPAWTMTKSGIWGKPEVPQEEYVQPGESTPWMDIGQFMDSTHQTSTSLNARHAEGGGGIGVVLDFSAVRSEAGLVRRIECSHPTKTEVQLTIPSNAPYDRGIYTLDEAWEMMWNSVKGFPEKGKIPQRIIFTGMWADPGAKEGAALAQLNVAAKMGYNSLIQNAQSPEDLETLKARGIQLLRSIQLTHYNPPSEEDCQKQAEKMEWRLPYVLTVSFGDEIHPVSEGTPEVKNQKFRDYLGKRGLGPEEVLGRQGAKWEDLQLDTDRAISATNPILWYESMRFSQLNALETFAEKTSWVEKYFGPEVRTGANYSPHPFYWPHPFAWVEAFKYRALTMPWSEDHNWQVPEEGPQMVGYLLDAFRCGAKYHDNPIEMDIIPRSPGNTSDNFRRITYSAVGRGVKVINHFGATPEFFSTENYVSWKDVDRRRAMYDTIREIGTVEDFLYEGGPPQSQAAILLSGATDIWETSKSEDTYNITDYHDNPNSNAYNHELKCLWLALRHLQMPADFLIEDDVADGYLKNYKVLYIVGDHIDHRAAEGIRQWVAEGGILFSVAGGGLLDEHDRRLETLLPVYGIGDSRLLKRNIHIRTKMELPRLENLDTITFEKGKGLPRTSLPVLAFKQTLLGVPGVEILGTYEDGTPALIRNRYGKGAAILCGTFPGAAYVKPAIPLLPWDRSSMAHFIPTDFSRTAKAIIGLPLEMAGVKGPVQLSDPLVEATVLRSAKGVIISLSNYSKAKRIERLEVELAGLGQFSKVWSLKTGELQFAESEKGVKFSLPMDLTDFIVAEF